MYHIVKSIASSPLWTQKKKHDMLSNGQKVAMKIAKMGYRKQ